MWAWTQNNQVRDICHGDPALCYHQDIAKLYDTEVPDGTENGATLVDGVWTNPPPPAPPESAPYVPPAPVVPTTVTMRQARLALLRAGKLEAITATIGALPSPQKEAAQIEWEYSQEVQRHNGFVSQIAPLIGLDDQAVDELFIAASKL